MRLLCCFLRPMLEASFSGSLVPLSPSSYDSFFRSPDAAADDPPARGGQLSILCWNLLAPPYRRMPGGRESDGTGWRARVAAQIEYVARADADIVALQEFWVANRQATAMWQDFAARHRYCMFVSPRSRGKQDGCCLLMRITGAPADNGGSEPGSESSDASCGGLKVGGRAGPCPEAEVAPGLASLSYNDWGDRIVQAVEVRCSCGGARPGKAFLGRRASSVFGSGT